MKERVRMSMVRWSRRAGRFSVAVLLAGTVASPAVADESPQQLACVAAGLRAQASMLTCAARCDSDPSCERSCEARYESKAARRSGGACVEPWNTTPRIPHLAIRCEAESLRAESAFFSCKSRCARSALRSSDGAARCQQGCEASFNKRQAKLDDARVCEDRPIPQLYVASDVIWDDPTISVCWKNPNSANEAARAWVRDAVSKTWQKESGVRFVGWGESCGNGRPGAIHILVDDSTPRVMALGARLGEGRWLLGRVYVPKGGMVLNFDFAKWGQSCASSPSMRESCVRSIAVHEFGHALGFAHEQNRADTPATCTDEKQGSNGDTIVGAWDLSSVMNYCNPDWNNNGALSVGDIEGVRTFYGAPPPVSGCGYLFQCPGPVLVPGPIHVGSLG